MSNITLSKLKQFCKLAKIDCSKSDTKDILKRKVNKYLKKYTYAPRYLRGLTQEDKFIKMFEIRFYKLKEKYGKVSKQSKYSPSLIDIKYSKKSKKQSKNKSKKSPSFQSKKLSRYTKEWNKKYGKKSISLTEKSKISGVPLSILKKVYNRGLAAWRGGSHRPGASQHQWGVSRVNSFLTCGKTWYYPDHKLVQEAMNKSPKAHKFWSKKKCVKSKMGKRTKSR
jgi:hypothetical protein